MVDADELDGVVDMVDEVLDGVRLARRVIPRSISPSFDWYSA